MPQLRSSRPSSARRSEWLTLGAAARLLGVDPDTLRRWADEGRINVFTTPGGHRRFRRAALESLITRRRGSRPTLRTLGATPERLIAAYRRAYGLRHGRPPTRRTPNDRFAVPLDIPSAATALHAGARTSASGRAAGSSAADLARAAGLSPAARAAFRTEGRRLVAALVAALDGEPHEREVRERQAAECCAGMARRLVAEGASLTDSIAAFVVARRPFLAEIGRLGARRRLDPAGLAGLYDDAAALLDRLLLHFVAAHRAAEAEPTAPRPAPTPGLDSSR